MSETEADKNEEEPKSSLKRSQEDEDESKSSLKRAKQEEEEEPKSVQSEEKTDDSDDDDGWVGPMPSEAAPLKKKRVLEDEKIFLEDLPCADSYERSYM
jgi:peptidylprolyl isomerase domain and WD repeat-containing protein 1